MKAITKIIKGANAARKATFTDTTTGIGLSEAQIRSMIRSGASLDGITVTNEISLTSIASMLEASGADKDETLRQAYTAMFTATGHTDAASMAEEIIGGANIADVIRRHSDATPIIKSGDLEFKSAETASVHLAGLNKAGKKTFLEGMKTLVKVNGVEENVISLGDLFKKNMPTTTDSDDSDDDTDSADNTANDDGTAPDRVLILVQDRDMKKETKVFAAKVTLYCDADTINALLDGDATTVKAITKVAGAKVATEDNFVVTKYLRHKNEISKKFSLMDKKKEDSKDSKSKKDKDKDKDDDED